MSKHSDPVFGNLDPEAHGYWTTTLTHGNGEVRADLNIDGDINIEQVGKLTKKLADLAAIEQLARAAMVADFAKKNSSVALFREHHEAILQAIEAAPCIPATREDIGGFLHQCELQRVALYPECPGHCMILDFACREPVTDYLLVVSFDGKDAVVGVDMQS